MCLQHNKQHKSQMFFPLCLSLSISLYCQSNQQPATCSLRATGSSNSSGSCRSRSGHAKRHVHRVKFNQCVQLGGHLTMLFVVASAAACCLFLLLLLLLPLLCCLPSALTAFSCNICSCNCTPVWLLKCACIDV